MHPIYCHFLDRELANLAGYRPTARRTATAMASAVLLADPFSFASLSGVHESPGIRPLHRRVLGMLTDVKVFASVSDVQTAEEFLASRRLIYAHDRRRYPFYFGRIGRAGMLFAPGIVKTTGTTSAIEQSLVGTILSSKQSLIVGSRDEAAAVASRQLSNRENRAITYALFRRRIRDEAVGFAVRKGISVAYSRHHIGLIPGATIIPGILQLGQFDNDLCAPMESRLPHFNWIVGLLRWSDPRFSEAIAQLDPRAWEELVAFALSPRAREFRLRLTAWKRSQVGSEVVVASREFRDLGTIQANVEKPHRWQDRLSSAAEYLRPDPSVEDSMSSVVIVHCVNRNERNGILRACSDAGMSRGRASVGTYVAAESLGTFNSLDFILVRSGAGSVGQDSAQGVVVDAIDDFRPRMVVAVGVAFGLKARYSVGAPVVLVASTIKNYERVRVGLDDSGATEIRDRGEVGNPDPIRLQKLRAIADHGQHNVALGQVLSGEKLVDHPGFRQQLRESFPDAVGGEMEASGVAAACARRRVPWLIIKAVSDDGDGSKSTMHTDEDAEQERAAHAAMRLTLAAAQAGCY